VDDQITFVDYRSTLKECGIEMSGRDERSSWRYVQDNHIRGKHTTVEQFYMMLKAFLTNKAHSRSVETLRKKMSDKCNFWKLDNLCGIAVRQEESVINIDVQTKKELDRLQRLCQRLPCDVAEKDTKERDWLFQRFDIGKTGRMVMAAADNMIHCRFGDVAYDVKGVIRASFRATKHVQNDDRAVNAEAGAKLQNEDLDGKSEVEKSEENCISRSEFRLFLLALKAHLELFIAFRMIDSSNDQHLDFDEFCIALPLLKRWGVEIDDAEELFNIIDKDHSGHISFAEFTGWALKEAIISDLEFRERVSQNVQIGEEVLLHGKLQGVSGKVIGWDKETKQWIVEYTDPETGKKKTTKVKTNNFSKDAVVNEVLPKYSKNAVKWIGELQSAIQPGTNHPWITEEPIRIKSEWSNRPGEYCFEIRAKMFDGKEELRGKSWGKSVKHAHEAAAKGLRTKILAHPAVKKSSRYVNKEVAKMREKERSRKDELTNEKKSEIKDAKRYELNKWKKTVIGKKIIDLNVFQKILGDCGVKIDTRNARMLFRFVSKSQAKMKVSEFDEFLANPKNVTDKKVIRLRESLISKIKMNRWSNYVSKIMATGDQVDEYKEEFERMLKKKGKSAEAANKMMADNDQDESVSEVSPDWKEKGKRDPKQSQAAAEALDGLSEGAGVYVPEEIPEGSIFE